MTQQTLNPDDIAAAESSMRAAGVPTHEPVQVDYFGFDETHTVTLPDGVSYVEHRALNEGQRRKYLNGMNRDVVIQRATGDARMSMKPGDERYSLLKTALTGWNLKQNGNALPFNERNLEMFLTSAPPRVIDIIDKEIRKVNAWLLEDMTLEDLKKERENLDELIAAKEAEEAGK
jgi:hypothetical protein